MIIIARYKVDITGINTSDIKVLSSEEMKELFIKFRETNDTYLRDLLVSGNLKLVLSILKNYNNKVDNMDDLFQVGCIGLLKAIDNFDLSYNVKFSTYAVPLILGEVKRYLRDNNSIRISRSIKDLAYQILKLKEELTQKNGVEPSLIEISKMLGIEEYEVVNAVDSMRTPLSMYDPIYNDNGDALYVIDQIADNKPKNYDLEIHMTLKKAMNDLSDRERKILINRFMIGKTQAEISDEIGISQAQVSRLEKRAISELKKTMK